MKQTTEQLAAKVNSASRAMWHAQMIVDGAAKPSPKVAENLTGRIREYKAASAAWAAAYFAQVAA